MYCNECGAQIPEESKFCNVCGAMINELPPQYDESQVNAQREAVNKEKKKKEKLPTWAKIWIVVCILAVAGLATFLTVHFVKKKNSKGDASITINGIKCEINTEDGISNIDKAQDGFVYRKRDGIEYIDEVYINGVLADDANPEDYDIVIEKDPTNLSNENVKIGCVAVSLYNFPSFKMGDGTNWGSSTKELEKAGYVYDGMCLYSKYYDKDGEIPLSRVNSDYDKILTDGFNAIDYSLSNSFPDIIKFAGMRGSKEENRKALIEQFEKTGYSTEDWDNSIKSRLLFSSETAKLSGMRKDENGKWNYVGSTSEFLVRVDYFYYSGSYSFTVIRIFAPVDKLNTYFKKWGLPDTVLYNTGDSSDKTQETETSEAQTEATTEAQASELVDISVADIPEYEALEEFFYSFDTYWDYNGTDNYDCTTAADGNSNILANIIGNPACVETEERYDVFDFETSWGETVDARGYVEDENSKWYMMGFHSVSTYGLKWVAQNIFNVSEADFVTLNNQLVDDDTCYIENDRYYYMIGGVGWLPYVFNVHFVKTDGKYYYITYSMDMDEEYFGAEVDDSAALCEAKMELKNIDGKNYWSMYYNHVIEPIEFAD